MEVKEGLVIAFQAIRANKMRSILTTLGIVIGIVSVTLMAAAIDGLNGSFEKTASVFGAKVLYVQKYPWVGDDDWWKYRNRRDLKVDYASSIAQHANTIEAVAPAVSTSRDVRYLGQLMIGAFVTGTTSAYQQASGTTISDGRFFSQEESDGGRPVCIIGANVADNLFIGQDPLDKTIKVGGFPYKVIGLMDKQGGMFGQFAADNRVYVPINSFISHYGGHHDVSLQVAVGRDVDVDESKEELRGVMRVIRRLRPSQEDDFSINQQDLLLQVFSTFTSVIATVGFSITFLSLLVGGIGIMNIMYVSVTERTKEIGIRKAIGARRRTMLFQFLVESAIICLIGGLIGLIIAYPLSLILDQVLPTSMNLWVVAMAILISLTVGVISGYLPSNRASKMDPVEALRYE
jgi:putative ABC transport system permease protein